MKSDQNIMVRVIITCVLLIAMLSLSACVTTTRGGFSEKKDDEKALEASVQLARQYIAAQDWELAKRHLKTAIEMGGNSAQVYEALALVYQNTGELELAQSAYLDALDEDTDNSRVRLNYAAFLYAQQDYPEAATQLERVTKDTLYEKRDIAFLNLARCYVQLEEFEKAERAYDRAYLMNKNIPGLKLEMATVFFQMQQFEKAEQYYNQHRQTVRQQSAGSLWLGLQIADQLNNADAFSSYALALKNLYPDSAEYQRYQQNYGGR